MAAAVMAKRLLLAGTSRAVLVRTTTGFKVDYDWLLFVYRFILISLLCKSLLAFMFR